MRLKDVTPYCDCRAHFLAKTHRIRRDGFCLFGRDVGKDSKCVHYYEKSIFVIDFKKEKIYRLSWR